MRIAPRIASALSVLSLAALNACGVTGTELSSHPAGGDTSDDASTNNHPAASDGGAPPNVGPLTGSVGPNGGAVNQLYFAVVGDTRPAIINDTRGYPTPIIQGIYKDISALSPAPSFVVSSGDYIFAVPTGAQSAPQLDLYMAAKSQFSGPLFAAMGNHECSGMTTSNCGNNNHDGTPANYTNFMTKMLTPIGKSLPYYSVNVDAADKSWTSKLVVIAANAWDSAQDAWLSEVMAQPTTYTFVVRHEPAQATTAPGVRPSEAIMARFPYTLAIVGHTHTYGKTGPKQVTIGNGGAPLTGTSNFGFGLVSQRADKAIQVDMIDAATGTSDLNFRFALKPDGSPAP